MASLNKIEKAILDMIAYAEGTLGVSQNGYDVTNGYFLIQGWTEKTTIPHGGKSWNNRAAGRYQFLYGTWTGLNDKRNVPMSKDNQDKSAIKLVKSVISKSSKLAQETVTIPEITNRAKFDLFIQKLAGTWASFPLTRDTTADFCKETKAGFGCYAKTAGVIKIDKLWEVFNLALSKY